MRTQKYFPVELLEDIIHENTHTHKTTLARIICSQKPETLKENNINEKYFKI